MKKRISMLMIVALILSFLPTISFAYKVGDIAGTIGVGTKESPVRCDNFSELKQALENSEIKYVRLDGEINEMLPLIPEKSAVNSGSSLDSAIKIKTEKHLILNGDATFTMPDHDATEYKTIVNLLHVMGTDFEISGNGTLTFRAFASNAPNAVLYVDGGDVRKVTTIQEGVTLKGSYNIAVYGHAIWHNSGSLIINGGKFYGENAYNKTSVQDTACAVVINGGIAYINGGEFRAYNKGTVSSTLYGVNVYVKNADVEVRGGKFYGFNFPSGKILADYVVTSECDIVYDGNEGIKQKLNPTFTVIPKYRFTVQPKGGTANLDEDFGLTYGFNNTPSVVIIERLKDDDTWTEICRGTATSATLSGYSNPVSMIFRVVARFGSNEAISNEFTVEWKATKSFIEMPKSAIVSINDDYNVTWKLSFEPSTIRVERLSDGIWTYSQGGTSTGTTITTHEDERTEKYRVVALLNGEEIISDEFTVTWENNEKAQTTTETATTPTEQNDVTVEQTMSGNDSSETQTQESTENQENEKVNNISFETKNEKSSSGETTKISWGSASSWAIDELNKANDMGVIPTLFDKQDLTQNITRKEFAYVAVKLYEKLTGSKAVAIAKNPFIDTNDVEVLKAYNLEITNGTSATTFDPDALITREQMATMMTRALTKAGIDTTVDLTKAAKFADDADMHDWGRASIYYMSSIEIIKGMGENVFGVTGNATREQALLISERSAEKFSK